MKDEYTFVPSEDFAKLEKELSTLKQNPLLAHATKNGKEMTSSISQLQGSLDELLGLFKKAHEELTLEQREEKIIAQQLAPVITKLNTISEQNSAIADALVQVSQTLIEVTEAVNGLKSRIGTLEMTRASMPVYNHRPQHVEFPSTPTHTLHRPMPTNTIPPVTQEPMRRKFGSLFNK
ncbi:MAG TPA: hypothetical protein VK158_05290 [Acidobacteriota bacterium]|nr:hypothetical protein [Acidobacteriota bacterium]